VWQLQGQQVRGAGLAAVERVCEAAGVAGGVCAAARDSSAERCNLCVAAAGVVDGSCCCAMFAQTCLTSTCLVGWVYEYAMGAAPSSWDAAIHKDSHTHTRTHTRVHTHIHKITHAHIHEHTHAHPQAMQPLMADALAAAAAALTPHYTDLDAPSLMHLSRLLTRLGPARCPASAVEALAAAMVSMDGYAHVMGCHHA